MASVKLRKRKNADGTTSLYLDIYTYFKASNGKRITRRKYEFLDACKLLKAQNPIDRTENKNRLNLAEQIKNKRESELLTTQHDVVLQDKQEISFKDYCTSFLNEYTKLNKKNVRATIHHFYEFLSTKNLSDNLFCRELTTKICEQFLAYLESNFNGETVETYFRLFKKIVKSAHKNDFIIKDIIQDVVCKKGTPEKKEILNFEEIALLAKAPCSNSEVKKAFLFSLYTGLRWVDVNTLTWQHIQGDRVKLIQAKTKHPIDNKLHPIALQLLGKQGKPHEAVFTLPSHAGATKDLKKWCARAGIHKNITWHCARHSFGTNIILHGETDVNTASKLLGHKTLMYTQRYVHEVESLKQAAMDKLPSIEL